MFRILLLSACVLLSVNAGYPYAEKGNIINLGEPTWDLAINEFPQGLLVYFYEPLCSPCRHFEPELIDAATELKDNSLVRFAKVECHDEVNVCNAQNIYTFPTLLLYRAGQAPFEYRGPRSSSALQSWVQKVVDFKFPVVNTESRLFSNFSTALLIKSVSDGIKGAAPLVFDEVEIATAGPDLEGLIGQNAAILYSQNSNKFTIRSVDSVEFIQGKVADTLETQKISAPNLNAKIYALIQDNVNHDFVIFFRTQKFKHDSDAAKAFDRAAKDLDEVNLYFVYANAVDDLVGNTTASLFGVKADDAPTVGVISKDRKILKKYKLEADGEVTYNSIKTLLEGARNGKGKRYYMSAEVPEVEKKGDVRELVNKNYDTVTGDTDKNVFVMLYYPWCEWCLKLEPAWNSLAYRFRDNKNVVIARIDVSKNDVQGFEASEYPILLFYKAGDEKEGVEYLSKKNINSLKKYLFDNVPGLEQSIEL